MGQGKLDQTAPDSAPVRTSWERRKKRSSEGRPARVKSATTHSKPQARCGGREPETWAGTCLREAGLALDYREGGGGSAVSSQPHLLCCQKQFQEPKEVGRQLWGRASHARIPSIPSLHEGGDAWGKRSSCYLQTVHRTSKGTLEPTLRRPLARQGALGEPAATGPLPTLPWLFGVWSLCTSRVPLRIPSKTPLQISAPHKLT